MDKTLKLLKEITDAPGVPGYESEVRTVIRRYIEPYAQVEQDRLGSIICKKTGASERPRIMLSGHMDEIGFMVKRITDEGFLTFTTLGGWWNQVMLAQRVQVITAQGRVDGVIGSKPPHILDAEERKKPVKIRDMFIDIGACSKEEVQKTGIRPGDPVVPYSEFNLMANGDSLLAKAWDDRVGCALFMETIMDLQNEDHPNTVFGVGSVQEEVGLRGARTSAQMIEPDIGFALEVGIAGDMPGVKKDQAMEELGQGPVVLLYDASLVPNIKLRDWVIKVAADVEIPLQFDIMERGGTDAGAIQFVKAGVPALVIGVPTRYIHSHQGIISKKDYFLTKKLLKEIVMRMDAQTVQQFTLD